MRKEKLEKVGLCFIKGSFIKPFKIVINPFFIPLAHLRIALVFVILTIAPITSESLLGNTLVLLKSSKSVWAPFHEKVAQYH